MEVKRGDLSMGRFYATYAAITASLVGLCLRVDIASSHRVLWVVVDTLLVIYVCLFNPWFRGVIIAWAEKLTKIERR